MKKGSLKKFFFKVMKKSAVFAIFVCLFISLAALAKKSFLLKYPNESNVQVIIPSAVLTQDGEYLSFHIKEHPYFPKYDGRTKVLYAETEGPFTLSAFLEKFNVPTDTETCKKMYSDNGVKKNVTDKKDIKIYKYNGLIIKEQFTPEFKGVKVNQKSWNIYAGVKNYCLDIHFSKTNFDEQDEKSFKEFLDSVKILDQKGNELKAFSIEDFAKEQQEKNGKMSTEELMNEYLKLMKNNK